MIFVTVGTQLPFDRLINTMDDWAQGNGSERIIAQTGVTEIDSPRIEARPFVDAAEFKDLVRKCDVLVAHAGMGSILTAVELGKPVIIMPRRADLGEHRNDHQMATADRMGHLANVTVVETAEELDAALEATLNKGSAAAAVAEKISVGHRNLVNEIRSFISAPKPMGGVAVAQGVA